MITHGAVALHNGIVVNDAALAARYPRSRARASSTARCSPALLRSKLDASERSRRGDARDVRRDRGLGIDRDDVRQPRRHAARDQHRLAVPADERAAARVIAFASERFILQRVLDDKALAAPARRLPRSSRSAPVTRSSCDLADLRRHAFSLATAARRPAAGRDSRRTVTQVSIVDHSPRADDLQRCTKCILPATYPFVDFDEHGVCRYCRTWKTIRPKGEQALLDAVEPYRSKDGSPDVIVAFSRRARLVVRPALREERARDEPGRVHLRLGHGDRSRAAQPGARVRQARRRAHHPIGGHHREAPLRAQERRGVAQEARARHGHAVHGGRQGVLRARPPAAEGDRHQAGDLLRRQHDRGRALQERPDGRDAGRPRQHADRHVAAQQARRCSGTSRRTTRRTRRTSTSRCSTPRTRSIRRSWSRTTSCTSTTTCRGTRTTIVEHDPRASTTGRSPRTRPRRGASATAPRAFYNYIYQTIAGFTEDEVMLSNMLREGHLDRDEALRRALEYAQAAVALDPRVRAADRVLRGRGAADHQRGAQAVLAVQVSEQATAPPRRGVEPRAGRAARRRRARPELRHRRAGGAPRRSASFNLVTTAFFALAVVGAGGLQYAVLRAVAEQPDDRDRVAAVVVGALVPNLVLAAIATGVFVAIRGPRRRPARQRRGRRGHAVGGARAVLLRGQQGAARDRQRAAPDARVRDLHVAALPADRRRPRARARRAHRAAQLPVVWTFTEGAMLARARRRADRAPSSLARAAPAGGRGRAATSHYGIARRARDARATSSTPSSTCGCSASRFATRRSAMYSLAAALAEGVMQLAVAVAEQLQPDRSRGSSPRAAPTRSRRWRGARGAGSCRRLLGVCVLAAVLYPIVIPWLDRQPDVRRRRGAVRDPDGGRRARVAVPAVLPGVADGRTARAGTRSDRRSSSALNFAAQLVLIPLLGMRGAAAAMAVAQVQLGAAGPLARESARRRAAVTC